DDPVRRDRRLEELLAVEDYKLHARALTLKLEKLHGPAHQAAREELEARKEIPPFLARHSSLDGVPDAQLRPIEDEARALLDRHGTTRYASELRKFRERLAPRLTNATNEESVIFAKMAEITRARTAGRFAEALDKIDEIVRARPNDGQLQSRMKEE